VTRRAFITLLGGAAAAWPLVAKAQPTGKSWRIGQVIGGSAETNGHFARALEQRSGELSYRGGGNPGPQKESRARREARLLQLEGRNVVPPPNQPGNGP